MNHEGEAVYPPITVGVKNPRLNSQGLNNIQEVVCAQLLRRAGHRRADHRLHHIHAHGSTFQPGAVVHHHGHLAGAKPVQGGFGDPGGDHGFTVQLFLREGLQIAHGSHNHMGVLYRLMQRATNELLAHAVNRCFVQCFNKLDCRGAEGHRSRQRGIGFQLAKGGKQSRYAEIQIGIGKKQVIGVFRQRLGNSVTGLAIQKQHPGVVKKVPQLCLGMAHRPLLQDTSEAGTGRHRLVGNAGFQPGSVRMFQLFTAHLVVIVNHAQANGISLPANRIQHGFGTFQVAIRAHPNNPEWLFQKRGFQFVIVFRRSLADTNDRFHGGHPCCFVLQSV